MVDLTNFSKRQKILIIVILLLAAMSLYLVVKTESAKITTFEECRNAGWLVRGVTVYDGASSFRYDANLGNVEQECVLWTGKSFVKLRGGDELVFGDDSEINKSCSVDEDCRLPGSYAIKSDCPYKMRCRENKCTVVCPLIQESSAPFFPVQDKPAVSVMEALLADKELILDNGCLRAGGFLLVWPYNFTLGTDKYGTFQVVNSTGHVVARVGDKIKVGGGADETPDGRIAKGYSSQLSSGRCPGPYWIVGEVVSSEKAVDVNVTAYCNENSLCKTGKCYGFIHMSYAYCYDGNPCDKCDKEKCSVNETVNPIEVMCEN